MEGKALGVNNDKMQYHHFVKALVTVSQRIGAGARSSSSSNNNNNNTSPAEQLLQLVDEYVIPRADDWNLAVWDRYRDAVDVPEVRSVFERLAPGLELVFRCVCVCMRACVCACE